MDLPMARPLTETRRLSLEPPSLLCLLLLLLCSFTPRISLLEESHSRNFLPTIKVHHADKDVFRSQQTTMFRTRKIHLPVCIC